MGAGDWGGGVNDAVGQAGIGFDLGAGPEEGVGDGGVRSDLAVGADPRVGDGGAFIYVGCCVNLRNLVTGFEVAADAVGLEVGVASAEVEPVTLVGVEGSKLFFFRQVEKGGDDGNFFVGRNAVEDGGVEAVDSGELMVACGDAEFVANVGHLIVGDGKMSGGTFAAHREGGRVVRSEMGGDEFVDGDIGEDVAVVDDDGIGPDEGGDVLDAATGFEEVFLVEKVEFDAAILGIGEGAVPFLVQVVGIDGDFGDSSGEKVIKGVGGHGTMKDGHQRFGHGVGHGLEAGSETRAEEESFLHWLKG